MFSYFRDTGWGGVYQNAYERLSKLYCPWMASISHVIFYYLVSTFKNKKRSGTLKVETSSCENQLSQLSAVSTSKAKHKLPQTQPSRHFLKSQSSKTKKEVTRAWLWVPASLLAPLQACIKALPLTNLHLKCHTAQGKLSFHLFSGTTNSWQHINFF